MTTSLGQQLFAAAQRLEAARELKRNTKTKILADKELVQFDPKNAAFNDMKQREIRANFVFLDQIEADIERAGAEVLAVVRRMEAQSKK